MNLATSPLPEGAYRIEPPRWWPLIWGALVGYVRAYIYLLFLSLPAMFGLGIDVRTKRPGLAWPFETDGPWSVLAGMTVMVVVLTVVCLCIRGSVAKRIERRVSASWLFLGLFTTYYVIVGVAGTWRGGVVTLLMTAALVRYLAVGRQPLWKLLVARTPIHLRRPLIAVVGAVAVAMTLTCASYALTHPLLEGGGGGSRSSSRSFEYAYELRNGTPIGLTVVDVRLRKRDAERFEVAGLATDFAAAFEGRWLNSGRTGRGVPLPGYSERVLILRFRGSCSGSVHVVHPEGVVVTYRLLERRFTQFVAIGHRIDEAC